MKTSSESKTLGRFFLASTLLAGSALLAGCATSTQTETAPSRNQDSASSAESSEQPTQPLVASLREMDWKNSKWIYHNSAQEGDTIAVTLTKGVQRVETANFELGEVVYADLNDDGIDDAAAALQRTDGNFIEQQWYIWVATEDGPSQIDIPIARSMNCGDYIESVEPVNGGVKIEEIHRNIVDEARSCAEGGSEKRVRTVTAVMDPELGWWPKQTSPTVAFGGLCPAATQMDYIPLNEALFTGPSRNAAKADTSKVKGIIPVDERGVYGVHREGWMLFQVFSSVADQSSCAWVPAENSAG